MSTSGSPRTFRTLSSLSLTGAAHVVCPTVASTMMLRQCLLPPQHEPTCAVEPLTPPASGTYTSPCTSEQRHAVRVAMERAHAGDHGGANFPSL